MKTKCLKIGANYSILCLCILLFRGGAVFSLFLPILQLVLTIGNYKWSSRLNDFISLQTHMLIATMAGNFAGAQLYLKYVSDDAESVIIFALVFKAGVFIVVILSIIAGIIFEVNRHRV